MNRGSPAVRFVLKGTFRPGISLAVAAVLLALSSWYCREQTAVHDVYSSSHEAINEDYDALVYRRRLVEEYHNRYQDFRALGFVGRESRLDWIETIRSAAKGLDLPNVSYSLEPQLEVLRPDDAASPDAEIRIYVSQLELEFGLVHELDLVRFFRRLQDRAPGLMKVDRCRLERQSRADASLTAQTNIVADCSMMIFSVITSDILPVAAET